MASSYPTTASTPSAPASDAVSNRRIVATAWIAGAQLGGTVPMWERIGDGATTFSY